MNPELLQKIEAGYGAQQRGDLATAEKRYREILSRDPENEFALNLLGVILVQKERFEDALPVLENAVRVNGRDPDTLNNLGLTLSGLNRYADAAERFLDTLTLDPRRPDTHNNLGNALAAQDMHADAVRSFRQALSLNPGYIDCMRNLAGSLLELGRLDEALGMVDRALEHAPSRADLHNTRGEVLLRDAQQDDAKKSFEASLRCEDFIPARINLSTALKQLGKVGAAESTLREVLEKEPCNAEAWHHLGVLQEQAGDFEEAADAFRQALTHNPRHASSWYQLAKLKKTILSAGEVAQINAMLQDADLLDVLRAPLYFALASIAEKDRDYAASIDLFAKAQAIKARRNPYMPSVVEDYLEQCQRMFPIADHTVAVEDEPRPTPVFVVGMPRSGTTLTEQVLTSHSLISGAGEVGFINDIARDASRLTETPFPQCISQLGEEHIKALRCRYFASMRDRCGEASWIVDKNPLNFNFVGFIATVFPEARIVYCRRDAVDNCVSIFRLPFDDNQGYSHDLESLGHYYRSHVQLMSLWQSVFAENLLQLDYESVVADLEAQARRLLGFVGVQFEPGVLRFFENTRTVLTPSAEQVRRPIYGTSVNQGRRYGAALAPLLHALGDLLPADYREQRTAVPSES